MTRICPSGAECPSQGCINRLRGGRCLLDDERPFTHEEIAAELRVDERTARRVEAKALAKMFGDLDLEGVDPDYFSTVIVIILNRPRRISASRPSGPDCAPHVDSDIHSASPEVLRTGRIPQRWSKP